jgi:hypothetical protein
MAWAIRVIGYCWEYFYSLLSFQKIRRVPSVSETRLFRWFAILLQVEFVIVRYCCLVPSVLPKMILNPFWYNARQIKNQFFSFGNRRRL